MTLTQRTESNHQRKGLSTDYQCLKARGYKPFFRPEVQGRPGHHASVVGVRPTKLWPLQQLKQLRQQHLHPVRQLRPQRTSRSVAINPSKVLALSGITVVNGTMGPLIPTEARAFNDVVGE